MFQVWNQVQLKADGRSGVVVKTDPKNSEVCVVQFDDGKTEEVKNEDLKILGA
jgi:hypothetical protein